MWEESDAVVWESHQRYVHWKHILYSIYLYGTDARMTPAYVPAALIYGRVAPSNGCQQLCDAG